MDGSSHGIEADVFDDLDGTDEAGLAKYKGKLKGAIVLLAPERGIQDIFKPTATRQSDENLAALENSKSNPQPQFQPPTPEQLPAPLV